MRYDLGRRRALVRGNGVRTDWTPDGISRLVQLQDEAAGTRADQTVGLTYNGVSQLTQRTASNDNYAFPNYAPTTQSVTPNALNQMAALNTTPAPPPSGIPGYDANGNLTSDPRGAAYAYNLDNQLLSKTGGPALAYDTAGRLAVITGGATVRFDYDGGDMIAESDAGGVLTRRYVHGPGVDEPLLWYEGGGTTDRRWLSADERGSVTAITDGAGNTVQINAYDENGVPAARNIGRFGYTGQAWLPEVGLAYYKARMYDPSLGRFLQSDPIGYSGGMNMYGYVRGDPVNYSDPSGLQDADVFVFCDRTCRNRYSFGSNLILPNLFSNISGVQNYDPREIETQSQMCQSEGGFLECLLPPQNDVPEDIIVTGQRCNAVCQANFRENERIKWLLWNNRFTENPFYNDPVPWLNLENFVIAQVAVGSLAASPGLPVLTARGTGLLNSNNILRFGYNWRGSAKAGEQVFRIGIGRRWGHIDLLP